MIEENIYNYLISFSSLTSRVNPDSIGWIDVPEEYSYPKIKFVVISKPTMYQSDDQWQRWRFYIIAVDKFECQALADILTDILNRLYGLVDGTYIDYVAKIDESPIELRDDSLYEMSIDFRVLYHN